MNPDREPIFRSSLRCLCNALGAIIGIFLAITLVLFAIGSLTPSENLPPKSELTLAPNAEGKTTPLPASSPVILRINVQGVIGMEDLQTESFQSMLADSLEAPLGSHRIKAILLYIDTPGGTASDSSGMYHALLEYKRKYNIPVYAFVDGLCASGGMYIGCAADKIYATTESMIGSVGARMGPFFNFSDLMNKVGVQAETITAGKDKDMMNPFRPWKQGEDACLMTIIEDGYEEFVSIVSTGRPLLTKEKLTKEYGAQVFSASRAQKLGYIDVAGANYSTTLRDLVATTDIGEAPYQVVTLSIPENFLSQLTQNALPLLSGKMKHTIDLGPYVRPEFSGRLLYFYQP